ncbi:P1 family peptidase [Collinsella sp. BA40]|uniref:P1 family peptidase n=1 Tax=Collinsella sp. BA40 TaxID=2560852 RepID=UPI0011CA7BDC|nr:P1 family peptidase [Collinsella sp. BA40]TXF37580.1 P1 family peptidase [Collinsella sp. BA40]
MALTPISITSIPGFSFGHYTDLDAATGCTAIVAREGATGGVDVRGAAPASRETDLLRPENTVEQVHAVILSGGSAYGLEAASGAARELEEHGIGLDVGVGRVPIVCSSCLFDLGLGRSDVRPSSASGILAVRDALSRSASDPLAEGSVGAGTGATVGKLAGPERSMKAGLGARAFQLGELQMGAVSAVNAVGNVVDPATLAPIAGMRAASDSMEVLDMEEAMISMASQMTMPLDRTNTTISCIVTNATLSKAQATKIAQMAADAYAHTIRPTHTSNDGDTIYVLASGALDAAASAAYPIDLMGLVATRALEAAICAGCTTAEGLFGLPSYQDTVA